MSESYCDAVFRTRVGSAIAEAASAISQFLGCDQGKLAWVAILLTVAIGFIYLSTTLLTTFI